MFADYHVHTEFSDDSVYPMEDVIKDAVKMGMDEICITDHVDYGVKEDWDSGAVIEYRDGDPLANVDYPRYMTQIRKKLRDKPGKPILPWAADILRYAPPYAQRYRCPHPDYLKMHDKFPEYSRTGGYSSPRRSRIQGIF